MHGPTTQETHQTHSPQYWEGQYRAIGEAEALVRGVLPSVLANVGTEGVARQAVRSLAQLAECLLREKAQAELVADCLEAEVSAQEPWLLKRGEVAAKLGIGESMLDKLVKEGIIPFVTVGSERRYPAGALLLWIRANTRYGNQEPTKNAPITLHKKTA